jgi:hypothetical protein
MANRGCTHTAMGVQRRCRGIAGHRPRQAEISERGNRGLVRLVQHPGEAHRRPMALSRDGVPVVVRGRESRPHGEGGQQVSSTNGAEEWWR